MTTDDTIIYRAWPEDLIKTELGVFKECMHNGASSTELSAGLLALDFLTRASPMSDDLAMFVGAAQDEAQMRITLMDARDVGGMTQDERRKALVGVVSSLHRGLCSVQKIIDDARRMEPDEVLERINLRRSVRSGP